MSGRKYDFNYVEELTAVLEQRSRLEGVSEFLEKHGADEEMLCAIEEAIEDLEIFSMKNF